MDSGPKGSLVFVFHSHIPYCRKAGMWPFGEEWLYEAMLESYIPLLELLRKVSRRRAVADTEGGMAPGEHTADSPAVSGVSSHGPSACGPSSGGSLGCKSSVCVTVGMTPILLDQLDDDYMRDGFVKWAEARLARAEDDRGRFRLAGDEVRRRQAEDYCERYRLAIRAFNTEYARDIVGVLGELQARGTVEVVTSAATHAYLPLLREDTSIRAQLAAGCESYTRRFGRAPRGIWLPECAYRPGLEDYLEALGLEYFFVDRHAIEGGEPMGVWSGGRGSKASGWTEGPRGDGLAGDGSSRPGPLNGARRRTTFKPYFVGKSKVACLGRNERVTAQVWSSWLGYPGDGLYREFHKRDDVSGLQYWRVTSRSTDLGAKERYDSSAASARLREHAAHFIGLVHELASNWWAATGEHGVIVAPYDTELFGHWWYEGVDWLGEVLDGISASTDVTAKSAGQALRDHPPGEAIEIPESSWGRGGRHDVWLNDDTVWMWEMIHAAEARVKRLAALCDSMPLGAAPGPGAAPGLPGSSGLPGLPGTSASPGCRAGEPSRLDQLGLERQGEPVPVGEAKVKALSEGFLDEVRTQALREFFLLMSSDWPFLVTERQATEYGARRFKEHAERFDRLMDYAERLLGSAGLSEEACEEARSYLAAVKHLDDPFPWLDFSVLSAKGENRDREWGA